jgi:hypothetical protein
MIRHQKNFNKFNHLLTICLVVIFIVTFSCYMYFLSVSVNEVVKRENANEQMVELRSLVSDLERQYIEAKLAVSNKIASHSELVENQDKLFLKRVTDENLVLVTPLR